MTQTCQRMRHASVDSDITGETETFVFESSGAELFSVESHLSYSSQFKGR